MKPIMGLSESRARASDPYVPKPVGVGGLNEVDGLGVDAEVTTAEENAADCDVFEN